MIILILNNSHTKQELKHTKKEIFREFNQPVKIENILLDKRTISIGNLISCNKIMDNIQLLTTEIVVIITNLPLLNETKRKYKGIDTIINNGIAYPEKKVCICSSFRDNFLNTILHEIYHLYGLKHCNKNCLMHEKSTNINLCNDCKYILRFKNK